MISDKFKCIFVEVPKTGSTSIKSILHQPSKLRLKISQIADARTMLGYPPSLHLNIWQIASMVKIDKFNSYFKFGFVRNPWDRAVSLYERKEGLQMKPNMSFERFIEWMRYASCTCIYPVPHRYQLDWFVNPHGDVIVDFIGKYENLENDWAKVARKLGIHGELPALNVNAGRTRDYTKYYSDRTKRIVSERFAVDIEYFGYKFGE